MQTTQRIKQAIQAPLHVLGLELRRKPTAEQTLPTDFEPEFRRIYGACREFTMTSPERMYALWTAVRYVCQNEIAGDFVECGVWKGGSSMLIALTLKSLGVTDRKLYLYDTYKGMSEPTEHDVSHSGKPAEDQFMASQKAEFNEWAYAGLNEVKKNLQSTGYPQERLNFVQGKVEETIPGTLPGQIALLRLDTDWYESTAHELNHLYPKVPPQGVVLIDDYGHWLGARKAVDEYIQTLAKKPLLQRIDYTGRLFVKTH